LPRLTQGFLRAILLEAGAAIQQPMGVCQFLHGAHCGTGDGNIRASFWAARQWANVMI